MLNTVFNAPHSLLQRSHDLRPPSFTDDHFRLSYLVLVVAATGVVLVAAIVAGLAVRVW